MKRPRPDTFLKIVVNRNSTVLATSLNELRNIARLTDGEGAWEVLFWALALGGRVAIVEVFVMPLEIRWCREHRDWCDIRAAGAERLVRTSHPVFPMLPA